eukprot:365511-Chlamydomonas_euryale.AAC.14
MCSCACAAGGDEHDRVKLWLPIVSGYAAAQVPTRQGALQGHGVGTAGWEGAPQGLKEGVLRTWCGHGWMGRGAAGAEMRPHNSRDEPTLCTGRLMAPRGREAGPQGREAGPQGREAGPQGREAGPQGREAGQGGGPQKASEDMTRACRGHDEGVGMQGRSEDSTREWGCKGGVRIARGMRGLSEGGTGNVVAALLGHGASAPAPTFVSANCASPTCAHLAFASLQA